MWSQYVHGCFGMDKRAALRLLLYKDCGGGGGGGGDDDNDNDKSGALSARDNLRCDVFWFGADC